MGLHFSRNNLGISSEGSILHSAVLLALTVILIVLAVLQYRWSGLVSEAERERMQKALNTAARQFREEFYREISGVGAAFQIEPDTQELSDRDYLIRRYKDWMHTSAHPKLISNLYLWETSRKGSAQLLRLNPTTLQFESISWPAQLESLHQQLDASLVSELGKPGPRVPPPFAWVMAEDVPALYRRLFKISITGDDPRQVELRPRGYTITELNLNYLQTDLFPRLTQRFFGGPQDSSYRIRVVALGQPPRVIYPPNYKAAEKEILAGDAVVDLLDPRPDGAFMRRVNGRIENHGPELNEKGLRFSIEDHGPGLTERVRRAPLTARAAFGFAGRGMVPRPALIVSGSAPPGWQLVIKHSSGSLEAAVAAGRRRNLALSFGILLLLALSAGMVFVSTTRARHLAMLQMEFVANVSHELRTPLAIVCSAAHNLASGIVGGKEQVQQYGTLIQSEGTRLSRMVQQILLFASNQSGKAPYGRRVVQIAKIIDQVLAENAPTLASEGFSLEKRIEPNLPPVLGDPVALGHCLQNLISNSIKYSGENRWIGVRACKTEGDRGPEVRVTVEDKGLGIEPRELKDIFKPFYRSNSVISAGIPGTGLGLRVAQSVAEAMGGNLSVESAPGKGSAFTLSLPALEAAAEPEDRGAKWGDPEGVSAQKGD
jgi:signal transduction histidine kinase/type II secretory pathway pseudopilin PulG